MAKACAANLQQLGATDLQVQAECFNDEEARQLERQGTKREDEKNHSNQRPVATAEVKEIRAAVDGDPSGNGFARLQVSIMLLDARGQYVSAPGKVSVTYTTQGNQGVYEQVLKLTDFHPRKLHESRDLADVVAATLPRQIMVPVHELAKGTYSVVVRFDDRLVTTAVLNISR
jgi:hypothetical protein